MMSVATLQPEPAAILACTVSRDVQNFELLIDDMEQELGEAWGDLSFEDALVFLGQPEAEALQFIALAVNSADEGDLSEIANVIRSARAHQVKVILVADQISPVALHQLMRHGADDFVPYPLPEGALRDAIERISVSEAEAPPEAPAAPAAAAPVAAAPIAAEPQPASQPQPQPQAQPETQAAEEPAFKPKGDRRGLLLPVHGMAGGAGASTFATNLAWELATVEKDGPRVCLMDLDFQYGSVATYLDLPRKDQVFEILTDPHAADGDSLIKSMQSFNEKLYVFTAPPDMLPLDIISPDDLGHLLDIALSNFDYVVIDMPKTVVAWTEAVLARAHVYFALIELDLRSAQNVLRFLRALKAEALPHEKLRYVLNRAPKFTDLSAKGRAKRMAESLDITIDAQMPDGGAQVTQANDHGLPLAESSAKNAFRKELQKLAKSLYEQNKAAASGKA